MSFRIEVAKRAGAAAVTLAVVLVLSAVAPAALVGDRGVDEGPEHPAWSSDTLAPDRLEATGEPDPDRGVGTVVFDQTHRNRFDPEDIGALTEAITDAGGDVRFSARNADLEDLLMTADVFVVVDPAEEYDDEEIRVIERFVRDGGRLVVFGEPDRLSVSRTSLGAALTTERSQLTTLGSAFGLSFGSEYLYDMETNDGNFKNIVVEPGRADTELSTGVEQVALPTATSVSVNRGTVVLRTAPSAEVADRSTAQGYPVAVTTNGGRVLAVGDTSFLGGGTASVGDNDVFIERIVEYMAAA